MKLLLDTQILLWLAGVTPRLSPRAVEMIRNPDNTVYFSVISIWEVVIKRALQREDFQVDASKLRSQLLESGFLELPLSSQHVLQVGALPNVHKDLFDRVLIAQAQSENLIFVTADSDAAKYPGSIVRI